MQSREWRDARPPAGEPVQAEEHKVTRREELDERLLWPGFSRREWDRLLFLRWLVRTGQVSEVI